MEAKRRVRGSTMTWEPPRPGEKGGRRAGAAHRPWNITDRASDGHRSSSSPPVRHSRIQSPAWRRSSAPATSAISSEMLRRRLDAEAPLPPSGAAAHAPLVPGLVRAPARPHSIAVHPSRRRLFSLPVSPPMHAPTPPAPAPDPAQAPALPTPSPAHPSTSASRSLLVLLPTPAPSPPAAATSPRRAVSANTSPAHDTPRAIPPPPPLRNARNASSSNPRQFLRRTRLQANQRRQPVVRRQPVKLEAGLREVGAHFPRGRRPLPPTPVHRAPHGSECDSPSALRRRSLHHRPDRASAAVHGRSPLYTTTASTGGSRPSAFSVPLLLWCVAAGRRTRASATPCRGPRRTGTRTGRAGQGRSPLARVARPRGCRP